MSSQVFDDPNPIVSGGALGNRLMACEAIDRFADLPDQWAGPDTVLPPAHTRSAAKALVLGLPPNIWTPHVSPSGDGEIGFSWAAASKRVDAILDVEGHLVWFSTNGEEIEPGGEVVHNGFFRGLSRWLRWMPYIASLLSFARGNPSALSRQVGGLSQWEKPPTFPDGLLKALDSFAVYAHV